MTIDIAIISQFRASFLKKCLQSIEEQVRTPDNVILVLNSKDKTSRKITKQFKKLSFLIKFYNKKGYAPLRNIALKSSESDFLYFVDDDCVLDRNAINYAYNFLLKYKEYTAIQGRSINYNKSFYSQFSQWTNDLWLQRAYDQKRKTLAVIDTKNVCFRRKNVKHLLFNECLGSEDVDFGLQIHFNKGKIGYEPKMLVYHNEQANNLFLYLKKRERMTRGLDIVKKKWGRLAIFYPNQDLYDRQITKLFKQSTYNQSFKFKLIFKMFLAIRRLKFFIEKLFSGYENSC